MATADTQSNATLSSEAYDLLDCFVMGLDSVVYEIAEDLAKHRRQDEKGGLADSSLPIQIEAQDVRKAADFVVEQLKQLIKDNKLPRHVADAVADMENCFRSQTGN